MEHLRISSRSRNHRVSQLRDNMRMKVLSQNPALSRSQLEAKDQVYYGRV